MYLRNRRGHQRKSLEAEGWIADETGNTWSPIKMLDISRGGFCFLSKDKLDQDTVRKFRFHLPDSSRMMTFAGRITYFIETFPPAFRMGVEFHDVDVADLATIVWIIDEKGSVRP